METYTENEKTIGLRTPVRNKVLGEYLGKVTAMRNVWYVKTDGTGDREFDLENLEVAQEYTKETVWAHVTLDIVHSLSTLIEGSWGSQKTAYESDLRGIRRQAYIKLGRFYKITPEIKAQVRETIRIAAGHLGVRLV